MVTISAAGAHGSAAATDRLPASKAGTKGFLTAQMLLAYFEDAGKLRTEFADADFPADPVDGQRHFRLSGPNALKTYQHRGGVWVELADTPPQSTVAVLLAVDAADTIASGTRVQVLGNTTAGDCHPFTVSWDAASAAAHNGYTVFRPTVGDASTGNGRWLRVAANPIVTFTSSDATPSIANGAYFKTSGSTTITDFDDAYEGQYFVVERGDADITITNNVTKIDLCGRDLRLTADTPRVAFLHANGVHRLISDARASSLDVTQWGARCDAVAVFDGAMTNGAAVLVCATSKPFLPAHVGKTIIVGKGVSNNGFTERPLVTTILSVDSDQQVTLSANCSNGSNISGVEVVFGTDDTTAWQAAINWAGATRKGFVGFPLGRRSIISSTLQWNVDFVRIVGITGRQDTQDLRFGGNPSLPGTTGLSKSIEHMPCVMTWAGNTTDPMLMMDVGQWADGTWVSHQGNGLTGVTLDGAGRAAVGLAMRSQSSCLFIDMAIVRCTSLGMDIGVSTTSHLTYVDCAYNSFIRCSFVNRGANIYGAKSFVMWGDKQRGNCNYFHFTNCNWHIENDGTAVNIEIESVDTTDFISCTWNGQMIIHSAETGTRSILNGQASNVELLASPGTPVTTQDVTLVAGTYQLGVTGAGGGGNYAVVSELTAVITGDTAQVLPGAPATFVVEAGGTARITKTGTLTAYTLKMVMRASQARTITLDTCSGWFRAKGSALGADFACRNIIAANYDIENIGVAPIIETNADVFVTMNGGPGQSAGMRAFGSDTSACIVISTASQTVPHNTAALVEFDFTSNEHTDIWGFCKELMTQTPAAARTLTLAIGTYKVQCLAGSGSPTVTVAEGTGVATGEGVASPGSPNIFRVTTAGTFTFTPTTAGNAVSSWSVKSMTRFYVPGGCKRVNITFHGFYDTDADGVRESHIYINGGLRNSETKNSTGYTPINMRTIGVRVVADDYIEVKALHTAGNNLDLLALSGRSSYLEIEPY